MKTLPQIHAFASAFGSLLLFASLVLALGPETLPTGTFEDVDGPGGSLVISSTDNKQLAFQLDAYGANRHTCGLSGTIDGNRGRATATAEQSICLVDFQTTPNAVNVQVNGGPGNFEACRAFCGARASFDRTYYKPPAGCTRPERQAIYQTFRQADDAKEYSRAFAELQRAQAECDRFFGWIERDRVHNHLALTLHHLDKNAECLTELGKTLALSVEDEAALRNKFEGEPMSFEEYLPTARTTWQVRGLCSGAEPIAP
jgi:hypothetical protein